MSIIDVKPDWRGFRSETSLDKKDGQAVFTVLFDENDDPAARTFLAERAPGIPRPNTSSPTSRWLYVTDVRARMLDGPFLCEVTVKYEAVVLPTGDGEPVDPIMIPAVWSWPQAVTTERIDRDRDGVAITNSAGQSFDPTPTEEVHELVGRVVFYRAAFNAVSAWEYRGAVNSDIFQGFPAETVKCTLYTAEEMRTPFGVRYRITMEFHMRWDGWKMRFLDEGYEEKIGVKANGKPQLRHVMVEDMEGNMVKATSPQPLDGNGLQLDDGAAHVFIERCTYRTMAFSALGLG